jgi:hypothetical protein
MRVLCRLLSHDSLDVIRFLRASTAPQPSAGLIDVSFCETSKPTDLSVE